MSNASRPEAEPVFSLMFFCALIFGFGWLMWHLFKLPILEAWRWLRYVELWTLNLVTHRYDACLTWLRYAQYGDSTPSSQSLQNARQCFGAAFLGSLPAEDYAEYYGLSVTSLDAIETGVMQYFRWPVLVLLVSITVYQFFMTPRNKFKTRHNLESFIKVQAKMWPVIAPIVNFNPAKFSARVPGSPMPDKLPPFAEALSPEEWVSWHKIGVVNNIPDREAARRAFLLQLGPRWNGIEGQPLYVQALFAAFALKGAQRREESDNFLGQLSTCWTHKGGFRMDAKIADEVKKYIRDSKLMEPTLQAASQHAYRTTAMIAALWWARSQGGVLAPAQFLWLRAVDRNLWYPLNNLGRRSFHTEGAAAMAHYMAEKNAKKALPIPRIDTAIVTLNQYLSNAERPPMPIPPREKAGR